MAEPPRNPLTPQALMQMFWAMAPSRVLSAAVQLNIFSRFADGEKTAEEVAKAGNTSLRGTRMLLDALTALGFLEKHGARYAALPEVRRYLVPSSAEYIGAVFENDRLWESWSRLAEAVQTGRPVRAVERQEEAEAFFPILIRSLHVINRDAARRLAAALCSRGANPDGLRVLDVAAGSAVWSIPFAEADRKTRVTAQDFPGVLEHTRKFAEAGGVAEQFEYLPGNLREVDFGREKFDLALLGNIVHSEGEASSKALFRRLHAALRPGGRLVIIDFLPAEDRSGPPPAVLFALNMLVNTETGDTFTLSEYRAWLTESGYDAIETIDIGDHLDVRSPAIVAVKH